MNERLQVDAILYGTMRTLMGYDMACVGHARDTGVIGIWSWILIPWSDSEYMGELSRYNRLY